MQRVTRITVSLPPQLAQALERTRARLRRGRSEVVKLALERWLAEQQQSDADRRYVEGYLKHPEDPSALSALVDEAVSAWEPWDEKG